jgi:TonB-dependent receptor
MATLALFRKDVGTFIANQTADETFSEIPRTGVPVTDPRRFIYEVIRPFNGDDAKITGFEVNYQHALAFLPAPLSGLGFSVTYTYAKTKTGIVDELTQRTLPLPNASKHSLNGILYYEQGPFSARVAYNRRSKFLVVQQSAAQGGSRYNDSFSQVDASASFKLGRGYAINFEGVNLTRAVTTHYLTTLKRLNNTSIDDRRFYLGVSATF